MKITAQSIAGLCLLVVANSVSGASDSVSEPFQVSDALKASRYDSTTIHYYLEMGSNEQPSDTLLLFFQGSDCNSVVHNRFMRELAHATLAKADLLLIEKRGITASLAYDADANRSDCPRDYIENDSLEQRTADADAVLSQIKNNHQYERVIVMGGSEGAVVAALFAAEQVAAKNNVLDAVVMLNGGGRWFIDDITHHIKATSSASEVDEIIAGFNGFAERVLNSEPFELEMNNHGYTWWRSTLTLDQQKVLSQVDLPVLVVQGGQDQSVSPDAVKTMLNDLHDMGNSHIELKWYAELDHGFFNPNGRRMTEEVAEYVSAWLKSVHVQR